MMLLQPMTADSPDIDARIVDPGGLLRDLLSAREVVTKDEWGRLSTPAPLQAIVGRLPGVKN